MPRLFVAIELPEYLKEQIAGLCAFGLPGVKWVEPAQLHLSLRFIGERTIEDFARIRDCLLKVQQPSFQLTIMGVGTFPHARSPRVVWVGVKRNDPLMQLHNKIEYQLNSIGIPGDKRKFHPHVTLGRVKTGKVKRMGEYLAHYDLFQAEPFAVEDFTLFSSLLTPAGAKYTREAVYPLS